MQATCQRTQPSGKGRFQAASPKRLCASAFIEEASYPCAKFCHSHPLSRQHTGAARAAEIHSSFQTVAQFVESRSHHDSQWILPIC
jgi:hypothetical protein